MAFPRDSKSSRPDPDANNLYDGAPGCADLFPADGRSPRYSALHYSASADSTLAENLCLHLHHRTAEFDDQQFFSQFSSGPYGMANLVDQFAARRPLVG